MLYILIFYDIPFMSYLLFILALLVLFVVILNPNIDYLDKMINLFRGNLCYSSPKKRVNQNSKSKNTKDVNYEKRLCDILNSDHVRDELMGLSDIDKINKLRSHLHSFIEFQNYIPNGDIKLNSIDFNLDKHYRINFIGNKWSDARETF